MSAPPLRRLVGPAAVLAAALGVAVLSAPRPGAAAPPPAAAEALSWVPADAAMFVHVDVQAVYASKPGQAVLKALGQADPLDLAVPGKAMPKDAMPKDKMAKDKMGMRPPPAGPLEALQEFQQASGLRPQDVATFTMYFPKLKGPGDNEVVVFAITLTKPYDRAKLLAAVRQVGRMKEAPKEAAPGVFELSDGRAGDNVRLVLTDPQRVVILGPKAKDMPKPRGADAAGPLSAAIAAAPGRAATMGLNLAQMPDEIRGDNLPPQAEPFKPLLQADAIVGGLEIGDKITLDVRAKCGSREKAVEAEKAMGVARTLLSVGVTQLMQQLDRSKDESEKALKPLLKAVQDGVKGAQFGNENGEAFARASVPADMDLGLLVKTFMNKTQGAASRSVASNNLKQIALAMHNYDSARGTFPAAASVGRKGKLLLSWRVAVLPYIEQEALYRKFKLDEPWDSEHNKKVFDEYPMPRVFEVPGVGEPGGKTTHIQVFRENGAAFETARAIRIVDFPDGTSNTILVVTAKTPVPWTKPDDLEFDPKKDPRELLLFVDDTCQVALADGSVRAIRKTVSEQTLKHLIQRNDGNVVGNDF